MGYCMPRQPSFGTNIPMAKFWKILLSVFTFFVVMLASTAAVEIHFGEPRPGFVPLMTLVIAGPILWLIWRKRKQQQ